LPDLLSIAVTDRRRLPDEGLAMRLFAPGGFLANALPSGGTNSEIPNPVVPNLVRFAVITKTSDCVFRNFSDFPGACQQGRTVLGVLGGGSQ